MPGEAAKQQLDEAGYLEFPGLVPPDLLTALRDRMEQRASVYRD